VGLGDRTILRQSNQHESHATELNSRKPKKKVIVDIEIGGSKISSASEVADAFNCHFANIGHDLARGIPRVDTQPEHYFITADKAFSSCSASEVQKLLDKLEVKRRLAWTIYHPEVSLNSGRYSCTIADIYFQSVNLFWYCSN